MFDKGTCSIPLTHAIKSCTSRVSELATTVEGHDSSQNIHRHSARQCTQGLCFFILFIQYFYTFFSGVTEEKRPGR